MSGQRIRTKNYLWCVTFKSEPKEQRLGVETHGAYKTKRVNLLNMNTEDTKLFNVSTSTENQCYVTFT